MIDFSQADPEHLALLGVLSSQEKTLVFPSFRYADAWSIGSRIFERARESQQAVAARIVLGDQLVFHAALQGTTSDNSEWLERKVRTVQRFGRSSYLMGTVPKAFGGDFIRDRNLDASLYTAAGGAFPLRVGELLVGVVAVSGLTEEEDHALVVGVIEEQLDQRTAAE